MIHGVNFDINKRKFLIILVPSGCGKSILLRVVLGLETITAGEVKIAGEVVNDKEPMDRKISMVFQNYAFFLHMTVS